MAKQTAVQWLVMTYNQRQGYIRFEDIDKAKAMEEQQIIDAWNDGICIQDTNDICGEYYYQQKYKNENNS